jgi:subtilase family serine protease
MIKKASRLSVPLLLGLACTGAAAQSGGSHLLRSASPHFRMLQLDAGFDPNAAVGGVPFCFSGSLGSILCYPPSFLKTAYHFPSGGEENGLTGRGQTIVIVDAFGSPTVQSDFDLFNSTFHLPAAKIDVRCPPTWSGSPSDVCPVKTVADLTTAPNAALCGATGWAEETTLDVTQSHGLAPGAKIVLVVAADCNDSSIYAAEQAVVTQGSLSGSVMSQSFGEPEDLVDCTALDPTNSFCVAFDKTLTQPAETAFETATRNHWTVIASTGDDGANEDARVLGTGELTPSFPSTHPLVLAAGGTQGQPYGGQYGPAPGKGKTVSCAAETNCNTGLVIINGGENGCGTAARPGVPSSCRPVGYGGEAAWNEFNFFGLGTSTGGGVSGLYDRPDFQESVPHEFETLLDNDVRAHGRLNPDVSFNAQIDGGVLAYLGFLGSWAVFGGTSASSPAWAAIIALANQANGGPLGFVTPKIYRLGNMGLAATFHDITVGNNSDLDGQFAVDGYIATPGYDLTTGEGTPNVAAFIQAIAGSGNH